MDRRTLQQHMLANQIDGWLLYDFRGINPIAMHVAGLTNSGSRRWFLWIPAEGEPKWLIHAIEASTFRHVNPEMQGDRVTYVGWRDLEATLPDIIGARDGETLHIAMEYSPENAIPYVSRIDAGTKELVERVTRATIVSSADLVQLAQAVLTEDQLESHRRAAQVCLGAKDAAHDFIRSRLRAGESVTEYEVQQRIEAFFAEHDMESDHPAIVAVNGHAADPHYAPSPDNPTEIKQGDIVLIDLWAREKGDPLACFGDITWTAYVGEKPPALAQELFRLIAEGRDAAVDFITERMERGEEVFGYEVDDVCRDVIARAGYADRFIHRTGHSLGVTGHFNGVNIDNLETQDRRSLIPGVMFTIEPGIYLPTADFDGSGENKGIGVRTEINCIVHENGVEITTLPLQTELVLL